MAFSQLVAVLSTSTTSSLPRHVIHILADDLGYGDPGWKTTHTEKVETPNLDRLVAEGVELPEHYSYKMCSPSRVSTLSGRYPYHAGYYNNNGGDTEGIPIEYTLLPAQLKKAGWMTHGLGKWHAGWIFTNYTPTYRGFDTCLMSSGNLDGYWGSLSGGHCTKSNDNSSIYERFDGFDEDWAVTHPELVESYRTYDSESDDGNTPAGLATDLIRGVGENVTIERGYGPGEYDAKMYTTESSKLITAHDTSKSFYLYMAFHNVHVPIQFPLSTVERYPYVATDARKGTDAMLTELDWTVGNISQALDTRGMLGDTLFIFYSDNGGPGSHAVNAPLRGGKFSFWEGGVRTVAFVSWKGLPVARRGTKLAGFAHLTDWYVTITEGIAGMNVTASPSGPRPLDGHNLWPAIIGTVATSPRTEVVHMPTSNQYNNASDCKKGPKGHGCSPAIRVGDLKLIIGWPGSDYNWTYDDLLTEPVAFGARGGTCFNETKCTAPHWKQQHKGSSSGFTCVPHCLFNVSYPDGDMSESVNLAKDPRFAAQITAMRKRLDEEAATGYSIAEIPGASDQQVTNDQCSLFFQTGFWLPSDFPGYTPGPTPTPPPAPTPPKCESAMKKTCPIVKGEDYKTCRSCCKTNVDELKPDGCKPKDFKAYCNGTVPDSGFMRNFGTGPLN